MVSFQRDGKLFDGNGVEPDVLVEVVPEYFIRGRDNVIEKALDLIHNKHAVMDSNESDVATNTVVEAKDGVITRR